ncbi:MAG: hypothetical protein K9G58_06715 [Bacteroidales bacterium]|nr:hypothetical protein [Bacteroidales bacterium]MCF8397841.1 hypothetical protein [Bacteroidales bacterium]
MGKLEYINGMRAFHLKHNFILTLSPRFSVGAGLDRRNSRGFSPINNSVYFQQYISATVYQLYTG